MGNMTKVPQLGLVAKGTSYNFIGALARNIFGFLFIFTLAKVLTVHDLGLFYLGVSVIMFITIIAICGMDVGLRRYISISHGTNDAKSAWDYFYTSLIVILLVVMFLGTGLFFASELIADQIFSKPELANVIKLFVPFIIFYSLTEILLSATQGYKHMKYWVICLDFTNSILRVIFILALPILGYGLYGVIVGYVTSIFITACLALYYFYKIMPQRSSLPPSFRFRELVVFSFPVALARLINSGNGMIETMLLGFFIAETDIGVYTVALKISVIGAIVLASFNTMFSPIISELHHKEEFEELQQLFSCVTRWAFTISLPLFMLIAWFSVTMLSFFGEGYIYGASCIVVLCLGQAVNSLTGPSGNLLLMSGYKFINLWSNIAGLVTTVLLNILLIPEYGILGCAWAVGISLMIVNIIRVYLAWKILDMHPYDRHYWKPILSASIVIVLLALLGPSRQEAIDFIHLMIISLIAMLTYLAALFYMGFNDSDKYVLTRITTRLGIKSK